MKITLRELQKFIQFTLFPRLRDGSVKQNTSFLFSLVISFLRNRLLVKALPAPTEPKFFVIGEANELPMQLKQILAWGEKKKLWTQAKDAESSNIIFVPKAPDYPVGDKSFSTTIGYCTGGNANFRKGVKYIPLDFELATCASSCSQSCGGSSALKIRVDLLGENEEFEIARFFRAIRLISTPELKQYARVPAIGAKPIVLFQAETGIRSSAINSLAVLGRVSSFNGVRDKLGWVGCGDSFALLSHLARDQNVDEMVVLEDDAELNVDLGHLLEDVLSLDVEWDVFCGIETAIVSKPNVYNLAKGSLGSYAVIDTFSSTVFSIFRPNILEHIAKWADAPYGNRMTIDEHINNYPNIRVLTPIQSLVGHDNRHNSTIWAENNSKYDYQIQKSRERLLLATQTWVDGSRFSTSAIQDLEPSSEDT